MTTFLIAFATFCIGNYLGRKAHCHDAFGECCTCDCSNRCNN